MPISKVTNTSAASIFAERFMIPYGKQTHLLPANEP